MGASRFQNSRIRLMNPVRRGASFRSVQAAGTGRTIFGGGRTAGIVDDTGLPQKTHVGSQIVDRAPQCPQ